MTMFQMTQAACLTADPYWGSRISNSLLVPMLPTPSWDGNFMVSVRIDRSRNWERWMARSGSWTQGWEHSYDSRTGRPSLIILGRHEFYRIGHPHPGDA